MPPTRLPLLAALLFASFAGAASTPAQEAPKTPLQPTQMATLKSLGTLGSAFVAWRRDGLGASASPVVWTAPTGTLDWGALPELPVEKVEAMLVPRYLEALPRNDGWGRPFEFRFAPAKEAGGAPTLVIRSLGEDGKASGERYPVGPYPSGQTQEDILWANGAFAHWPKP